MNIRSIHKIMEADGFALIAQGHALVSHAQFWRYMHKETFELIVIGGEEIDDEEFANVAFGIDEDEIEELLNKRIGKANLFNVMFDWENKDFRAIIEDLIEANTEVLKVGLDELELKGQEKKEIGEAIENVIEAEKEDKMKFQEEIGEQQKRAKKTVKEYCEEHPEELKKVEKK